jgi:hypothetical protein
MFWRDQMQVRAYDWLGQFSALRLEHVEGAVGGTVDGSMSDNKGVMMAERAGGKCGWVAGSAMQREGNGFQSFRRGTASSSSSSVPRAAVLSTWRRVAICVSMK